MKRNTKILLVLFSAIIITSGCMDGEDTEANVSPIAVNDFSITPNPVPGDQDASIQMELENTGDQSAEDVYARLFGPTFASGEGQARTWRLSSDHGAQVTSQDRTMEFGSLEPATDTSPAIPGRSTVQMRSPSLDEGRVVPYTFNSRIQYKYRTTGDTEIQIMSNERYQEVGGAQTQPPVETSDGPIQMSIQGTTPHVFYDVGTADEEICVTLVNQGSGTPFLAETDEGATTTNTGYDIPDSAEDKVRLEVSDVGNVRFSENEATVQIIGNEGYQCFNMELEGLGQITDLEQTTDIPIEARYGYEEETSTSVTVEGRRDGGSSTDTDADTDNGDEDDEEADFGEEPENGQPE